MLVHAIWLDTSRPTVIDATSVLIQAHLADRTLSAIGADSDDEILLVISTQIEAGLVQGSLSEYFFQSAPQGAHQRRFWPPFVYTRGEMFLAVDSNNESALTAARVSIGYTLEKVSRIDFIAALVA